MGKAKDSGERARILELLHGGEPLPAKLKGRPKGGPSTASEELSKLRKEARKAQGKLIEPPLSPASGRVYDELRAVTDKVAKRKPALPAHALPDVGGGWGAYTVIATPPYVDDLTITGDIVGEPEATSYANAETGELGCKFVTNRDSASSGSAGAMMTTVFKPVFREGKVSIRPNMDIDFAWWVNSIGTKPAISRAHGVVRVFIFGTLDMVGEATFLDWSVSKAHGLDFDFGTHQIPGWSLNLGVEKKHYYLVEFVLNCEASGVGWIGSIAGSQVNMRVPSIRFDFEMNPVAEQA